MDDRFEPFLSSDEALHDACPGTLLDASGTAPASVGVTDRRLLCVLESEGFVDVGYDDVCSIRSRSRTRLTYQPHSYRLLLVAGYLLATLSFIGVVVLASGAGPLGTVLLPVSTLSTVGALVAVEHAWLSTPADEGPSTETDERRLDGGRDVPAVLRRHGDWLGEYVDGVPSPNAGVAVAASLGCLSLLVVAVLSPTPFALVLALFTAGGVALLVYAQRRKRAFEGGGIVRRRDGELVVATVDGGTVRIRVAPESDVDRELSRRVRQRAPPRNA